MGVMAGTANLSLLEAEVANEPGSVADEPSDSAAVEPVAEEPAAEEPAAEEPAAELEPADAVTEPELVVEPAASNTVAEEPLEPVAEEPLEPVVPEEGDPVVWRNGWVCDGELELKDARLRDWAIERVSFLPGSGYERIILHLDRTGPGSAGAATLTAEAIPTARVKQEVPAVRQPASGRTTIALQLRGGVSTEVGLRGYKPSGLAAVKELSTYPVGRDASRVLVSAATSGCFRVRAPAFTSSPDSGRGQIILDVKS